MKDLFKVNSFEELMETAKKDSETKNLLHSGLARVIQEPESQSILPCNNFLQNR